MKVFLDDEREAPEGWIRTHSAQATIKLLETGGVTHLSLDHDLGDDERWGTGYDVVLWLEEQVYTTDFAPPQMIKVHSANSGARPKMEAGIRKIRDVQKKRESVFLTSDDYRLILDKIGREVVVESNDDFKYEVVTRQAQGYHSDPEIAKLQGKLSIMLEARVRMEEQRT